MVKIQNFTLTLARNLHIGQAMGLHQKLERVVKASVMLSSTKLIELNPINDSIQKEILVIGFAKGNSQNLIGGNGGDF